MLMRSAPCWDITPRNTPEERRCREKVKLQSLQDPSQINGNNLINVIHETISETMGVWVTRVRLSALTAKNEDFNTKNKISCIT